MLGRRPVDTLLSSLEDVTCALSPLNNRHLAIQSYQGVLEAALHTLSQPRHGLVYVHFPVPHVPAIFDNEKGELSPWRPSHTRGYVENLVLFDHTLGVVRRRMSAVGTWDRATVVLTSDHPWRDSRRLDGEADARTPFLVKLPQQGGRTTFRERLLTTVLPDLVVWSLENDSITPEGAEAWLRERVVAAGAHARSTAS